MSVKLNRPDASVLQWLEQLAISSKTLAHTIDLINHRHPIEHISVFLNFFSTVDHQLTLAVNHKPPIDLAPLIKFFYPFIYRVCFF